MEAITSLPRALGQRQLWVGAIVNVLEHFEFARNVVVAQDLLHRLSQDRVRVRKSFGVVLMSEKTPVS